MVSPSKNGIYFHIPFCRQACHYCDFHFATSLRYKEAMVAAIKQELTLRKDYLNGAVLDSVYFGGGTPSLLTIDELTAIFNQIAEHFTIAEHAEITLEANPDDLTEAYLNALRDTPVNRLSIGIQSFSENDLAYMNRIHTAKEAVTSVENALNAGFENLTVDLIYGTPTMTMETWEENLRQTQRLGIPHLSCYALTVEERTPLYKRIHKGMTIAPTDEQTINHWERLQEFCEETGLEQYEISNFAYQKQYARHNTGYWFGMNYLGIGPAAHSYNGTERSFAIANNQKYMTALLQNQPYLETESLPIATQYNEYVMTSLRTRWGCSPAYIAATFGATFVVYFTEKLKVIIAEGLAVKTDAAVVLTKAGKLKADSIAATLFF